MTDARLSRSTLYVPGSRPEMIEKASRSRADAVCIDLEDAVPPDLKESSRAPVAAAFQRLDFGGRTRILRINGLDTVYAYRDVIEVVEAAGPAIDLVMLPKAGSPDDVRFVDRLLTQIEARLSLSRRIGIEAQIETAAGFVWVREIAAASPRLEALIFGSGDYAASMRMPLVNIGEEDGHDAAYPGHRWHGVMHAIVAAARANGLRCIDGPYADLTDTAGLERAARIARALGFDGKQCIHPNQIDPVNAIFSPSAEEVAWARSVTTAYQDAARAGRGAAAVGGKMIDAVNLRMAQTTLRAHDAIEARTRTAAR